MKRAPSLSVCAYGRRKPGRHRPAAHNRRGNQALVPPDFLSRVSYRQMSLLPRYLRAAQNSSGTRLCLSGKDRAKEAQINVYRLELDEVRKRILSRPTQAGLDFIEQLAHMIEEFSISLFAPEIKTLFPISASASRKSCRGCLRERPSNDLNLVFNGAPYGSA